jgi:hypothetical protein
VRGDLTDDYYDPRRGVRLDVSRWWLPPASSSDPDFFRIEYNIAKDVRTLLQVAVFYEMGSAADLRSELGDLYRPSYGAGFRMVTASGLVIRADVASGREGIETTIIFGYPWESF